MSENRIRVQDLTARYDTQLILNHLNFEINSGEIMMIVGGSGSGKTTLLNHLIGLYSPESGRIFIENDELTAASETDRARILQKIGVMYQSGALFGSMNLLENVKLPLQELTDLPKAAIEAIAYQKLKWVGLAGFETYMPDELSGGMQKRAAIARAMALDPKILFLDEPGAGLDPITASRLDELILHLAETLDITFVIVSHELASIYKIAKRVILLHEGKILAEGDPHALRDHSDIPYVQQFFNRLSQ